MAETDKNPKKCEKCIFFINKSIYDNEINKTKKLQQYYLEQIENVNKVLLKYTKKLDGGDK